VCAKQKLSRLQSRGSFILCPLLAVLLAWFPCCSRADSPEDALRDLARRVLSSLRGNPVWLNLKNRSVLRETEFKKLASIFTSELRQHGAKIVSAGSGAEILLSISESPTGFVGVVEIRSAAKKAEIFVGLLGRAEGIEQDRSPSGLVLQKELLFSQDRPLIDAAFYSVLPIIDTLGQAEDGYYELKAGRWTLVTMQRLPLTKPPSRDLRGRLGHSVDAIGASFSTEICRAGYGGWHCESGKGLWPPHGVSPEFLQEKRSPPWFSAAEFTMNDKDAIIMTGQDGLARLYSNGPDPISSFPGWGSEIASIQSGCGSGWQILVTGKSDWTTSDSIQALEVDGDQTREVTPAIAFPGPVIGLHLSGSSPLSRTQTDGAIAIVNNILTGRYEVYVLTINCPH
jgi:hypothetical protein